MCAVEVPVCCKVAVTLLLSLSPSVRTSSVYKETKDAQALRCRLTQLHICKTRRVRQRPLKTIGSCSKVICHRRDCTDKGVGKHHF